jgi:hypothetical protein
MEQRWGRRGKVLRYMVLYGSYSVMEASAGLENVTAGNGSRDASSSPSRIE